jgi:hypothetical protein
LRACCPHVNRSAGVSSSRGALGAAEAQAGDGGEAQVPDSAVMLRGASFAANAPAPQAGPHAATARP